MIVTIGVFFLPESPLYLLRRGKYGELREALETIASVNGTKLDWEATGLSSPSETDEKTVSNASSGRRRPDKAENVLKVSGLPSGTSENKFRDWIGETLSSSLHGLVYHVTLEE